MAPLPGSVLFACGLNRVRSPMARGLMGVVLGGQVFVDSCGVHPDPGGSVDPFAAAVMSEAGIDISRHRPKTFDELDDDSFDLVVSLSAEAHHRALAYARGRAVELEYWPTDDPTVAQGGREQVLEAYRTVRSSLAARIAERFPQVRNLGGQGPGA
jgi:protein-tyrosine-phosphatase